MRNSSRIFVAGYTGLLGSALIRLLLSKGFKNVFLGGRRMDFRNYQETKSYLSAINPEYIFMAAARVGNIADNIKHPVDFLEENLLMQNNIFRISRELNVNKLLFFSSNCFYPKKCPQPMKEEYVMTGPFEETNRAYATAKLAGLEMCRSYNLQYKTNFIVAVPASIYGENDHFEEDRAHVLPSLIKKFHDAKMSDTPEVILWGDGSPRREFIYVDDAARAGLFLMENFNPTRNQISKGEIFVNAGTGVDYSITELAEMVKNVVGYKGRIVWDTSKPNGMPRKLLDSSLINRMGWYPQIEISEGIKMAYNYYLEKVRPC